jgi:hypothetical protein
MSAPGIAVAVTVMVCGFPEPPFASGAAFPCCSALWAKTAGAMPRSSVA